MGCPEPTSTKNPFVDVQPGDYFYKPVLWAVEKGITNGMDATHFGPTVPCTRAHVVTFLWRAHEKPAAGTNNPFVDVPAGQYYTDAVLWAVSKGITNGIDATHFGPDRALPARPDRDVPVSRHGVKPRKPKSSFPFWEGAFLWGRYSLPSASASSVTAGREVGSAFSVVMAEFKTSVSDVSAMNVSALYKNSISVMPCVVTTEVRSS